jgi:hypothetical protein
VGRISGADQWRSEDRRYKFNVNNEFNAEFNLRGELAATGILPRHS